MKETTEQKKDTRRYVATGEPNIMRLERHGGDTKGPLYFLVKRQGKRWRRALETSDLAEAKKRARVLKTAIQGEKWSDLTDMKTRTGWPLMSKLYEIYLATATIKTANRAVKMMKHFLKVAGKDENGSSSQLGAHTVWQFQQNMMKAAGKDLRQQAHAAISANSIVRQARSLFAAHIVPAYKGLTMPDMTGFLKAPKIKAPRVQYVEPPSAVITRIGEEYPLLKQTDPGAYALFLLGAFLGLRNNEARVSEWTWVEADGEGKHWLRLATLPHWKTKTSRGRDVEIPVAVLAELQSLRGAVVDGIAGDPKFLIPAHHNTERNARVFKRLNRWLRARGLDEMTFPKGFYELRKYFGNLAAWESGDLYRTARKMGNSPAVVEKYYSAASGRAPVQIPAPVVSIMEAKNSAAS